MLSSVVRFGKRLLRVSRCRFPTGTANASLQTREFESRPLRCPDVALELVRPGKQLSIFRELSSGYVGPLVPASRLVLSACLIASWMARLLAASSAGGWSCPVAPFYGEHCTVGCAMRRQTVRWERCRHTGPASGGDATDPSVWTGSERQPPEEHTPLASCQGQGRTGRLVRSLSRTER